MGRYVRWFFAASAGLGAALSHSSPLPAQESPAELDEHPRIEELTFEGVSHLKEKQLLDVMVTQETRCRSIVARPFCLFSNSRIFVDKHFLDEDELARDELRIRVLYYRRGYRQTRVASEIIPRGDEEVDVRIRVFEGPPTVLDTVAIAQTKEILSARQIRRAGLPRQGQPFDLDRLDTARIRLQRDLWDEGYADGVVRDSILRVDSLALALYVSIDPNRLTTVGEVQVRGNEDVSERTIRRLLDLRPGQPFRRNDMTEAQRRLYQTELFRQTLVQVPETSDSAKTVVVSVREAPFRAVRTGIGLNTVEFVQLEARFTRYDWLGSARRLDLRGAVGNLLAPQLYGKSIFGSGKPRGAAQDVDDAYLQPTWQVGAEVTQPFLWGARNSLGIGVFAHRRSVPDIVIDRGYGAQTSVTRRFANRFPVSLQYRFEQTRVEAGDVYFCINFGVCRIPTIEALRGAQRLSPVWLTANVDRTDDPLAPSTGHIIRFDAEHASAGTFSDFRYNRLSGEASRYMRMGRAVLAGRVRAGWVHADGSTNQAVGVVDTSATTILHPRKRFYAGGARSVRGFGENLLGPRILTIDPRRLIRDDTASDGCSSATIADGSCDPNFIASEEFQPRPLGGTRLLEASVEYRFPFTPTFTGAVFVDAGLVRGGTARFQESRAAVTPGFGIRYQSPVGPVRIDLGIRPKLVEDLTVVTQVADSTGNLRLIQLELPKRYDPLEDSHGFIRGVLGRLQLHLAIGEAF